MVFECFVCMCMCVCVFVTQKKGETFGYTHREVDGSCHVTKRIFQGSIDYAVRWFDAT